MLNSWGPRKQAEQCSSIVVPERTAAVGAVQRIVFPTVYQHANITNRGAYPFSVRRYQQRDVHESCGLQMRMCGSRVGR